MSQNNSSSRSFFKTAAIIPLFIILGITFGCEPTSIEKDKKVETIILEVSSSDTIKLNGEPIQFSDFESQFSEMPLDPEKTILYLKVHQNATIGIVTDIQEIIRKQGVLKINYSTIQSDGLQKDKH